MRTPPPPRSQVDALARLLYVDAGVTGSFATAGRDSRAFYRQLARGVLRRFELLVRCRECGCTDLDCSDCIERTGEPCSWVPELETDAGPICSACAPTDYTKGEIPC